MDRGSYPKTSSGIAALTAMTLALFACSHSVKPATLVPTQTRSGAIPSGSSSINDPINDVTDRNGRRVLGHQGVDITSAQLIADGKTFTATLTMAGPIPSDSGPGTFDTESHKDRLLWVVDLWNPLFQRQDVKDYQFRLELVGKDRGVYLGQYSDHATLPFPGAVTVDGSRIRFKVSLSALPLLRAPFEWSVLTEWGYYSPSNTIGYQSGEDFAPKPFHARATFSNSR